MSSLELTLARLRRTRWSEWPARTVGLVRRLVDRVHLPGPPDPGPLRPLPVPMPEPPDEGPALPDPPCPLAMMRWRPSAEAREGAHAGSAHDIDVLSLPLDPRIRWEAARLQDVAASAMQGAPWARDEALGFLDRHPPGLGLHWASSLEVALRLVSIAGIASRFPHDALAKAIATHASHIARHPSVGTSARNHRVGELVGLAVAAKVLPDCPAAADWWSEAETLGEVLRDQLFEDGLGVEQSTYYLCFVLDLGWIAWHCGVPNLAGPLGRGLRALRRLQDGSGTLVSFGDADGGRAWPSPADDDRPYPTVVIDRLTDILGSRPPPNEHHCFGRAGLTVLRCGGSVVAFDHGPIGEPHLGGHGHDDQLALWVHLPDGPAIGGRGTGSYHDPVARRFHRSAAAHATLTVADRGPSEPHRHPFLWERRSRASLEQIDLTAPRILASHDGYADLGVRLARQIRVVGCTLLVDDWVHGEGPLAIAWTWPLHPRLSARIEGRTVVVHDRVRDRMTIDIPDEGFTLELVRGGTRPGPGWHAVDYGEWTEATTLQVSGSTLAPRRFTTRIGFLDGAPVS